MQKTARIFVSGHVQAVGYRMFVRRYAEQFGVTGFVQNLPDGRVKIVASGDETIINSLLEKVRQGPRYAVVRDVDVAWSADYAPFARFEVR